MQVLGEIMKEVDVPIPSVRLTSIRTIADARRYYTVYFRELSKEKERLEKLTKGLPPNLTVYY